MDWSLILLQLTLPHCGLRGSSKPLRPAIVLRTVMKVSFSVCCDMQALLLFALGPSYSLILFCCVHGHVFSFDFYNVELICKYGWMEQSCGISAISKLLYRKHLLSICVFHSPGHNIKTVLLFQPCRCVWPLLEYLEPIIVYRLVSNINGVFLRCTLNSLHSLTIATKMLM